MESTKRHESEGVFLTRREDEAGKEEVVLPSGEAFPVVSWDSPISERVAETGGVVLQVGNRLEHGGWQVPVVFEAELPERIRSWRKRLGEDGVVIVSGGVEEPSEAVELMEAGVNLVLVDAGLIFNGPGLVKRCNAALLDRRSKEAVAEVEDTVFRQSWLWALALGIALAGGGALALGLSFSRVLLPYDEQFLGFTSEVMQRSLPKLHAFMAHDRGTLAGVMLGLGWFYGVLAWGGIRMGVGGAKTAVVASALAGFASFFSFLGFGYFDTLHAFVAAILFQFSVQVMVGRTSDQWKEVASGPDDEDPKWRRAQWGQFCWVLHAVGLILAGCVILGIGMTRVFVSEDLAFLCMSAEQVRELGDRVVSVVAHDRATLGGMLWASGMGMLLPVLWCHQRGASWLWWAVLGLGVPA
jgi:dihydroorotate dehydrogenase